MDLCPVEIAQFCLSSAGVDLSPQNGAAADFSPKCDQSMAVSLGVSPEIRQPKACGLIST